MDAALAEISVGKKKVKYFLLPTLEVMIPSPNL